MKRVDGWVIPKWLVIVIIIVIHEFFWHYAYRTKCNCDPNGIYYEGDPCWEFPGE